MSGGVYGGGSYLTVTESDLIDEDFLLFIISK